MVEGLTIGLATIGQLREDIGKTIKGTYRE